MNLRKNSSNYRYNHKNKRKKEEKLDNTIEINVKLCYDSYMKSTHDRVEAFRANETE
ncbi:MAG: hypothetical protein Q4B70_13755 [Lachnospiraceae bacterium]|nr:hypothetical protein [Lachnospiraceae bacterium]